MILFSLVACITADNFLEKSTSVGCARLYECDKGGFESAYSDMNDCKETSVDDYGDYFDCYAENCEFDAGEANDCLKAERTDTCEEITSGDYLNDCDYTQIYNSCDDSALTECLLGVVF